MNELASEWARHQALTEERAFDYAIRSMIKKDEYDDRVEQAFREGYIKGIETAQKESLDKFNSILEENIELRKQVRVMHDMNSRLRETIIRGSEEEWE